MSFDLWTILLIASASQSLFLIIYFLSRPASNISAKIILIALLSVILAINISNIITSSYLYRAYPAISGFARGMVLLLGPMLYLYTMSITKAGFRLVPVQLFHFLPYAIAFIIIRIQEGTVSDEILIAATDSLMAGTVKMDWLSNLWFVSYFVHLLFYIALTYIRLRTDADGSSDKYQISIGNRKKWLRQIIFLFILIAVLFMGITWYVVVTGLYTVTGNFFYTLVLAVLVYIIAYQATWNRDLLLPGFSIKYSSAKVTDQLRNTLLPRLVDLFEKEKIFIDPNLKISTLAQQLDTNSHVISQIINDELNKSFSELLNHYRIKEFKSRVKSPDYAHFSIMGIAYDVGYSSKSTFNTAFKKLTGLTPSEYLQTSH